jgi:hypothetical protein
MKELSEEEIDLILQLLESKIITSDDPEEINKCNELITKLSE